MGEYIGPQGYFSSAASKQKCVVVLYLLISTHETLSCGPNHDSLSLAK